MDTPPQGLTLLIGGARSGKSALAQRLVASFPGAVTVVVTAEAGDDEMAERIAVHRADRPSHWSTVEAPRRLAEAVSAVPDERVVLVDCVTLWVANLVIDDVDDHTIEHQAERVVELLADRSSPSVVVTNEVGQGIVPGDPLSRRFRDVHGRVNRRFADRADRSFLVVAGQVLPLQRW